MSAGAADDGRTRRRAESVLPTSLRRLLGAAAVVVVIAGVHAASGIVGPIVLAMVITILLAPARAWLATRLPNPATTVVCVLLAYLIVLGIGFAIVFSLVRFAELLPAYSTQFVQLRDELVAAIQQLTGASFGLAQVADAVDPSRIVSLVESALTGVTGAAGGVVLLLALCLFMAVDAGAIGVQLVEARRVRGELVDALAEFARASRRYLVVSTVFGLIVAVLDTIALAALGIPEPLLWGLLAFLTNYIPNIGFVIGLVPPALLALLDSGPQLMMVVIVVYSVLNLSIQSGVQPKVVGDAVGLSSTITFVSLVFWSWILGPIGTILAVPLSLLVRTLLVDANPDLHWLAPLIAGRGATRASPQSGR